MSLPFFQLHRPKSLDEAVVLLSKHKGEIKVIAGGTDLLPSMKQKLFTPPHVLDLRAISELRGIYEAPGGGLSIGALTTLAAIEHSPLIRRDYSILYQAAKTVASPVLRNMGTIGGNICLDTRCLWYNQSLLWRKSCGFCLKKDGDLCHVAPGCRPHLSSRSLQRLAWQLPKTSRARQHRLPSGGRRGGVEAP